MDFYMSEKDSTSSDAGLEEPIHFGLLQQVKFYPRHLEGTIPSKPGKPNIVDGIESILLQGQLTERFKDVRQLVDIKSEVC